MLCLCACIRFSIRNVCFLFLFFFSIFVSFRVLCLSLRLSLRFVLYLLHFNCFGLDSVDRSIMCSKYILHCLNFMSGLYFSSFLFFACILYSIVISPKYKRRRRRRRRRRRGRRRRVYISI